MFATIRCATTLGYQQHNQRSKLHRNVTCRPMLEDLEGRMAPSATLYAVGADAGHPPEVRVFDSAGNVVTAFLAYDPGFMGGVRVALGDVNKDNVTDIIVAPGPGGGPDVRVIDGTKLAAINGGIVSSSDLLDEFYAYDPRFSGGVYVAYGVDVIPQGSPPPLTIIKPPLIVPEIITGPGAGGGPDVKVFAAVGGNDAEFYAYSPLFPGGVRVAAADVNNDGRLDIITAPGRGGGPDVRVVSGAALNVLQDDSEPAPSALLGEFNAYSPTFSGGVYVAATGRLPSAPIGVNASVLTGADGGDLGPRVRVVDATKLNFLDGTMQPTGAALIADFFAYDPSFGGGVRVGYADVNNDGVPDIITGPGFSGGPEVKVIDGTKLSDLQSNQEIAQTALLDDFYAFAPDFVGGIFVGG
jgi:hypothetical protein